MSTVGQRFDEINQRLDDIVVEQKKQAARLDNLSTDRDILEDILGKQGEIYELWKTSRKRDHETAKSIKEEIHISAEEVKDVVEEKVEGLQPTSGSGKRIKKWFWQT